MKEVVRNRSDSTGISTLEVGFPHSHLEEKPSVSLKSEFTFTRNSIAANVIEIGSPGRPLTEVQ